VASTKLENKSLPNNCFHCNVITIWRQLLSTIEKSHKPTRTESRRYDSKQSVGRKTDRRAQRSAFKIKSQTLWSDVSTTVATWVARKFKTSGKSQMRKSVNNAKWENQWENKKSGKISEQRKVGKYKKKWENQWAPQSGKIWNKWENQWTTQSGRKNYFTREDHVLNINLCVKFVKPFTDIHRVKLGCSKKLTVHWIGGFTVRMMSWSTG